MIKIYKPFVVIFFLLLACQLTQAQKQAHLEKVNVKSDSIKNSLAPVDSISSEVEALKQKLQHRLDSLNTQGNSILTIQNKLDSLNGISSIPNEEYKKLSSLHQQSQDNIIKHSSALDTIKQIQAKVKNSRTEANSVSTELGIGPLGNDIQPGIDVPGINIPASSSSAISSMSDVDKPALNTKSLELPEEINQVNESISNIGGDIKEAGGIASEVNGYSKDIETIREDGLSKSEKLPELAEQQASQLEEIKAIEEGKAMTTEQVDAYKKQIEQYKNEKQIEEELKEKLKEVANDVVVQNQSQIDESMKKISKYKRKFSSVHDLRNLPKRAPNPLKDLSWRERVIPGITFQTLSSSELWLAFDPHIYYRITGSWSAGVGGIYRFTMNRDKLTFDDFNSMYGYKVMARYSAFKGIFIQAEGHRVTWKPWETRLKDPDYKETIFVAAAGIGKSHTIAKRLKGNIQALYHYAWGGDPYKPKIMLKFGFDFLLAKKEKKPWEQRLKELKDCD